MCRLPCKIQRRDQKKSGHQAERTYLNLKACTLSAVGEHSANHQHVFDQDNVRVIAREDNFWRRQSKYARKNHPWTATWAMTYHKSLMNCCHMTSSPGVMWKRGFDQSCWGRAWDKLESSTEPKRRLWLGSILTWCSNRTNFMKHWTHQLPRSSKKSGIIFLKYACFQFKIKSIALLLIMTCYKNEVVKVHNQGPYFHINFDIS